MPAVWVNTLGPTIGLLNGTRRPENTSTRSLAVISLVSSICVRRPRKSWMPTTTSSRGVLPARSPMPLTVQCTQATPASTAASVFAVAMP